MPQPNVRQLGPSGATENQGLALKGGLWVPADVVLGLTSVDASVTITANGDGTLDLAAAGGSAGASGEHLTPYGTLSATKNAGNPTLVDGTYGVMPENITKVGATYWLLYSAKNGSTFTRLHLASSSSPEGPWTPYSGNPILTVGSQAWEGTAVATNAGCIVEHGGTFYLFYAVDTTGAVTPGIGVATASAITGPYTKDASNPILSPGAAGAWDSLRVQEPDVRVMADGTWVMAYMGEDSAFTKGTTEKLGIATATSPTGPWTKKAANPVIGFGAAGQWDAALAADPSIWQDPSGYWWMLYSGTASGGGPAGAALGLAWALDPTGTWTRYGEILAPSGTAGAYDESGVFRGAVYVENGTYYLPFCAVAADGTRSGANALLAVDSAGDLYGHETATDPHPQYLTEAEADALYEPLGGSGPSRRWEVLMASDGSGTPLLASDGSGDWLYGEVT